MAVAETTELYWDPYDAAIDADPYPIYKRLRAEAPLYWNDKHEFFALSRYDDVAAAALDAKTFISGRGAVLELMKANIEIPPGVLIFDDPPTHDVYRGLLSRVFTPKRVAGLEPQIRAFCARALDPFVGSGGFDFVQDLGRQMPMRVISMLLGIPEQDQETVRDAVDDNLRTEAGEPMRTDADTVLSGDAFGAYIDWRVDHPSDDIMTELLTVEFEDHLGVRRRLTRQEILTYVAVVAGAGNETTTRLVGWTGKLLGEHPDQRRQIVEDRSKVQAAIEEILRYEGPAKYIGRTVARDTELHGRTVPEGSRIALILSSANRDEGRWPDADRFDINREITPHIAFGFGPHFCLGAALARLEGRIALEEVIKRFPDWEIDTANAKLAMTSTVRGWETLPVVVP